MQNQRVVTEIKKGTELNHTPHDCNLKFEIVTEPSILIFENYFEPRFFVCSSFVWISLVDHF